MRYFVLYDKRGGLFINNIFKTNCLTNEIKILADLSPTKILQSPADFVEYQTVERTAKMFSGMAVLGIKPEEILENYSIREYEIRYANGAGNFDIKFIEEYPSYFFINDFKNV